MNNSFKYKASLDMEAFDLWQILLSGQCFRSAPDGDYAIIEAGSHRGRFSQEGSTLLCEVESDEALHNFWLPYFDGGRDYKTAREHLSKIDSTMEAAIKTGHGVRVLRQPVFETLITFIISQRSSIPRIKGVVKALCERYGEDMGDHHAFPTPERLASLGLDELATLKAGYRTPYLHAAAQFAAEGGLDLIGKMPYEEAKELVMGLKGVGIKVASCFLLFAGGYMEAFPIDVWIEKAINRFYAGKLDHTVFSPYAGLAQQYMFYYIRHIDGAKGPEEYMKRI